MDQKRAYDQMEKAKKILTSKRCVFSNLYSCSDEIVRAHTIAKCLGLRGIAEEGHVYSYDLKLYVNKDPDGRGMRKMGINEVSTFYFACSRHDNDLFKEIESDSLKLNEVSASRFFLRSMAQEVYEIENQIEIAKLIQLPAEFSEVVKVKQSQVDYFFGRIIKREGRIKYRCFKYSSPLPFLATTAYCPFTTVRGEPLFDSFDLNKLPPTIVINVFNSKDEGRVLFSWPEEFSYYSEKFIESVFSDKSFTNTLLGFLFTATQNLVLRPSYYEGIPKIDRDLLQSIFRSNIREISGVTNYFPKIHFGLPEPLEEEKN